MSAQMRPLPDSRQFQLRPLGPDSLFWRHFGDSRVLLLLGQGLTMEVAHPVIGQGVADHSSFRTDPYGRLLRSLTGLWPVVYNTPEGALQAGARLRERHRGIKGRLPDGKAYHAFDPEAYLWVHMHLYDATMRLAGIKGEALTAAQQQQLFCEWRQLGLLLGLREQDMPADLMAFWARFDGIIRDRLVMTETLSLLLPESYYLNLPRPPLPWLPDFVWQRVRRPFGRLLHLATRATLPPLFREKFSVPWTRKDEQHFRRLAGVMNMAWKLLPPRWRYLPQVSATVMDARRNPGHYHQAQQAVLTPAVSSA